jgi:hypothetical protein
MNDDQESVARLANRLLESAGQEGVYYVVPFPTRWRLYGFPWEVFGDVWHGDVWRRFVIEDLAEAWSGRLKIPVARLKAQLEPWPKSVPRGRIERAGVQEYTVYHADDLDETHVSKRRIEMAFELTGNKVAWSIDPHEARNPEQRAHLRQLLNLTTI